MSFKTIIEPFKVKSVEPIAMTTREERKEYLKKARYNPFKLQSEQVMIDLLTDSGTSAMSSKQWSALMDGDESYAGARSWIKMEEEIKDLTGFPHILPTHQGRAAERILYGYLGGKDKVFLSNTHFDTTRANIEYTGATAIDCPSTESDDPDSLFPFKGNISLEELRNQINEYGADRIAAVILTVTNNSGGGQPVSMENAQKTREICDRYNIPLILDACRVAENAYFIQQKEDGYNNTTCREIASRMFRVADGCVMSAKKDAFANMGGFLALKDEQIARECTNLLIITEGYTTYGGLSGRDMEAITVGLREIFEPSYLQYRIVSTTYMGNQLYDRGIPIVRPVGGHAVYVDAKRLYNHIPVEQFPGQALVCDLYEIGGIRSVEIGSVMFGKYDEEGNLIPAPKELVRLAFPRRVYTQSHYDYVIEVFEHVLKEKEKNKGYRITWEPPFLRHFTAEFEPVS